MKWNAITSTRNAKTIPTLSTESTCAKETATKHPSAILTELTAATSRTWSLPLSRILADDFLVSYDHRTQRLTQPVETFEPSERYSSARQRGHDVQRGLPVVGG